MEVHPGQPLANPQELLMAAACVAAPRHLARSDVESREQHRRAVADVVMATPFDLPGAHWAGAALMGWRR